MMDDEAGRDASIHATGAAVGASPVTGECVGTLPEEGLPVEVAGTKKMTEDEVKKLFLEVDELLADFTPPQPLVNIRAPGVVADPLVCDQGCGV